MADLGPGTGTPQSWQIPPAAASEQSRLGWLRESMQEGQAWLQSQRGYSDMRKALDILSGRDTDHAFNAPAYRPNMNTNHLKRNVREVVATLSKLRPFWGYNSDNPAFLAQAEVMNKTTRSLYTTNFYDREIKKALQFAAATCTGFIRPMYRRELYGRGRGDIVLRAYGSPSVLPFQMPSNNDYQSAYSVTLLDQMPIAMAHAMFPLFQHLLKPASSQYWYSSEMVLGGNTGSRPTNLFRRIFGRTSAANKGQSNLICDINYTTTIDLTINTTDQMIPMGEPGTSWYYEVPNLNSDIYIGRSPSGQPLYRKATETDSMLYPYRRLQIHSEGVIMYDGPTFNWHGRLDLIPFCLDAYPWEGIGFSLVHDGYPIQQGINELDRGMFTTNRARLDPALGYDINAVSKREAQRFDPMEPRAKLGFDGSMVDKPFQMVMPPEQLETPQQIPAFRDYLSTAMDHQMGVNEMMALAKAKAGGIGDETEKLLQMAGPIVDDQSRDMEVAMREVGEQVKWLILQWKNTSQVMQLVGPEAMTPTTFDFDPSSLVPSHLPGEDVAGPSVFSRQERAKHLAENLPFYITPGTLHEIVQMQQKLLYLQVKKIPGFPIDSRTVAEAAGIPNFGNKPEGNTVYERYQNEQEDQLIFAARMKEVASGLPGLAGGGAPPGAGGSAPEGRPPSFSAPPTIQEKDGGTRTVTATSK